MTLYDFISLTENEKALATWTGKFLADRFEEAYGIQLYSIDDFFVEVFYNIKINKIEKFRPFTSKKLLEPYLGKIKIIL